MGRAFVRGHYRQGRWVKAHSRRTRDAATGVGLAVAVVVVFLVARPSATRPVETTDPESYVVTNVVDGDTLDVVGPDDSDQEVRVRLLGINAPEATGDTDECFGAEASAALHDLADGADVHLVRDTKQDTTDRYGRTLAYVIVPQGDVDLSREMLSSGHALTRDDDPPISRAALYDEAENDARMAAAGLWGSC